MAAWWQTASTPSSARSTTSGSRTSSPVGEIEHPDVVPVLAQRIDDVRADEAGATGDEDHGRTVGALGPRCAGLRTVQEAVMASGVRTGSIGGVPDVILPVLDEAAAIPWVLERMPPDCDPIVVDNGSTDGSGGHRPAPGRAVIVEPVPGFGAACFAGLEAAARRPRLLHGLRRLARSGRPVARARARRGRDGRPRARGSPGRAPAAHAHRQRRRDPGAAAPQPASRCATWDRCGPPAARRCSTSGSPTGASAGRWRWSCARRRQDGASPRSTCAHGPREGRSKVTGTVRGTLRATRDMTRLLASIDPMTPSPAKDTA